MRVIVSGSRAWDDREAIFGALDLLADAARYNTEPLTVVHGAAKGADTIADEWVRERQLAGWPVEVERHPADWSGIWAKVGRDWLRAAGYARNTRMVRLGADACLVFVLGGSRGATHCGREAESAGIRTQWVRRDHRWMPSPNLGRLHAVRLDERVYRVRPLRRDLPPYAAQKAVCGREIELAVAPVLGEIAKCRHCVKAVCDDQ